MKQLNKVSLWLGAALVAALGLLSQPTTALQSLPKSLPYQPAMNGHGERRVERLRLGQPVLPPFAHSLFCLRMPKECEVKRMAMRRKLLPLNDLRRAQLAEVNALVNDAIAPYNKSTNVLEASWSIGPSRGDCNDYAVTKRHQLQALGWPSDALLLAEVVTSWGEHHLILVARTQEGDFVLDNLAAPILSWSKTNYRWVRMQSPKSPKLWWTVNTTITS